MKEEWSDKSKYNTSKRLIVDLLDSLTKANSEIEFAIRIFGHQSPNTQKNCQDSRLEIPFGRYNPDYVNDQLGMITPQGWTPIAYSLFMAADDFPDDPGSKNAIILITDGLETCGGDLCAAGTALQSKRISLRPFIIGMGLGEDKEGYFDCVGRYFDASDAVSFKRVLNTVISQALNTTTAQINLLNEFGKPTESDVAISLYDSYSSHLLYNFIHTLNAAGFPDTLQLDPVGKYDIEAHTIPSITKTGIELIPGRHNIIAISTPQGTLSLNEATATRGVSFIQCIVRKKDDPNILYIQDINTSRKFMTGTYDLEILTLPRIKIADVEIKQSQTREFSIERPGTLSFTSSHGGVAGIYIIENDEYVRVYEFKKLNHKESLNLQPGEYTLIFRLNNNKNSNFTRMETFEINSGLTTTLRF